MPRRLEDLLHPETLIDRQLAANTLIGSYEEPGVAIASRQRALGELMTRSSVGPKWVESVDKSIQQALALEAGWNGPRTQPIDRARIAGLLVVLSVVELPNNVPPAIVPLSSGGVQAEWHAGGSVEVAADTEGVLDAAVTRPDIAMIFEAERLEIITEADILVLNGCLRQLSHAVSGTQN